MTVSLQDVLSRFSKLIKDNAFLQAEHFIHEHLVNQPDNIALLSTLAHFYHSRNQYDAAQSCFERILDIQPANFGALSNYANMLQDKGDIEAAVILAQLSCELEPDNPSLTKNLANKLRDAKRFEEAIALYQDCLKHNPDDPAIQFDIGFVNLYLRNLDEGWSGFEKRLEMKDFGVQLDFPLWAGEDLTGKSILLYGEQGLGDIIFMARFFPDLIKQAENVGLCCDPSLFPLFNDLKLSLEIPDTPCDRDYDFCVPLMSLPVHIQKDWQKWPQPIDIQTSQTKLEKYKWISEHSSSDLNIGIVWSGNIHFRDNDKRSIPYSEFLKLASEFPDFRFFNLQKGPKEKDVLNHGAGTITPLGGSFRDFGDTAAALKHMDLIIMTDSALAHLAGSLHIPTINMLHYRPYWIYFPEENTTPLYPSMRLLRQDTPNDWDNVLNGVRTLLTALKSEKDKNPKSILACLDRSYLDHAI